MSQYVTVSGYASFRNQDDFDRFVDSIKGNHGWLENVGEDYFFIDENRDRYHDRETPDISTTDKTVSFPYGLYRNLGVKLSQENLKGMKGTIVWTTTDGAFQGGVISDDGTETLYNLEQWWKEQGEDDPNFPSSIPPSQTNDDDYFQWFADVEAEFHQEFGP